jgi:serine/threonine protein phosphatase PrpC
VTELAIEIGAQTDVGRKRRHNEDFIIHFVPTDPEELTRSGRLYIVADGVGGAAAGEVASEYAAKKVLHEYYHSSGTDIGERLRHAVRTANADIHGHVQGRPEMGRMGTTIVAAVLHGDEVTIVSVGDSRVYLIRENDIQQITRDHSLVAKLIEEGSITPEEAKTHPKRNVVLRSIGADAEVYPDVFDGHLQPGDQIMLCSDGLTRHVSDSEIFEIASTTRTEHAAQRLVDMANARGGKDNISVMLIHATGTIAPSVLAETAEMPQIPVRPEFDAIHDTAARRLKPRSKRLPFSVPDWAWVAAGGALGVLFLLGVLYAGRPVWDMILTWTSPLSSPMPTVPAPTDEATPTVPIATLAPDPTSMIIPTQPEPRDVREIRYSMPAGKVLDWVVRTWRISTLDCIERPSGITDPDFVREGEVLLIPAGCLTSDGPVGKLVFAARRPNDPSAVFALDINGRTVAPTKPTMPPDCGSQETVETYGTWRAVTFAGEDTVNSGFGDLRIEDITNSSVVYEYDLGPCVSAPVWSPSGRYIAFVSKCGEGADESDDGSDVREVWVVLSPAAMDGSIDSPAEAGHLEVLTRPDLEQLLCWLDKHESE